MKKKIEYHSVANIFPMMTGKELESLKQDIAANGLREPIWLFQGKIIDGRNRYIACLETGIEPVFRKYEGSESDLIDFVISLNLHRRHLNTSQKACLAVDLLPEIEKRTKENLSKKMSAIRKGKGEVLSKLTKPENSRDVAAKIFGVSGGYISLAKQIKDSSFELFERTKKGELTLQKAKAEINKNVQVLSTLTKPETGQEAEKIELSKYDIKKMKELVSEFSISEQKAREYILKQKIKRKPKELAKKQKDFKEIKVRIPQADKDKLTLIAKQQGKSIAELLRTLLNKNILLK